VWAQAIDDVACLKSVHPGATVVVSRV
jgi:hypothetical protein